MIASKTISPISLRLGDTAALINSPERFWMAVLLIHNYEQALTVREFSALSGLSLGFISKFSNLLRGKGFLKLGRKLQVMGASQLLDILRDLYFFEGNTLVSYYSPDSTDEILKKIKQAGKKQKYALTRMCGASLVAPYVRYQLVDFYVEDTDAMAYWKKYLKLVDVEISGNVNLVIPQDSKILAQIQGIKGWSVVNNIQLYLDLYKYPARGREQAEYLREQVLKV